MRGGRDEPLVDYLSYGRVVCAYFSSGGMKDE